MNRTCPAVAVAVWLMTSPAWAQAVDGNGVPFRLWDFNTGVALHFENAAEIENRDREFGSWRGIGAFELQGGRYWTSHLKTEAGVLYAAPDENYGGDPVAVPGGMTAFALYRVRTQVTHASGSLSYQFFENVFAHPYVSAGARVAVGSSHKIRDGFATLYTRGVATYPIPPLDEDRTILQVRPFAAAGFKSYFTERTFVRSELSAAFGSHGPTQVSLGLGFGVDF
jgi:hypothetical protein